MFTLILAWAAAVLGALLIVQTVTKAIKLRRWTPAEGGYAMAGFGWLIIASSDLLIPDAGIDVKTNFYLVGTVVLILGAVIGWIAVRKGLGTPPRLR